jgi:hypothetical protein
MASLRLLGIAAALAILGVTLGGCPVAAPDDASVSEPAADDPSAGATVGSEDGGEGEDTLRDVARDIVTSDQDGDELAWSDGFAWVQTGPDYRPEGVYPPESNPYGGGSTGGSVGGRGPTGSDGSGGTPGGEGGAPSGGGGGGQYSGVVYCTRHESLEGHGEMSEDLIYQISMDFGGEGGVFLIPIPIFIVQDLLWTGVSDPGDTATYTVPFGPGADYTVTVTVVLAAYTPERADVTIDLDVSWYGEHSSIVASGTHRLLLEFVGEDLDYESYTQYDAVFWAEGWGEEYGTEEYDCQGTLTP